MLAELQWPAVVKFDNDPELGYARTVDEGLALLQGGDERTVLLDSSGALYRADGRSAAVDLALLTLWVRDHAAALDQCCVAKIHVRDSADAIAFVAQLEEAQ